MHQDLTACLSALADRPGDEAALEGIRSLGSALVEPRAAYALSEARRVHAERGDVELCLRLIDLELEQVTAPARRVELLVERAAFLVEGLLNETDAVAALEEALRLRPDDPSASDALSRLRLVEQNRERIISRYLEEAEGATDKALQTGLYQSAAEMYARRDPAAPEVEELLKRALEVSPRNLAAERHLERYYKRLSRWDDVLGLHERRAEAAAARDERVAALMAAAEIVAGPLAEKDLAADYYRKVLAIDPAEPRALSALGDHLTAAEDWKGLLEVYEAALARKRAGATGPAMLLQVAMLAWKKVGDRDAAERHFREIRKTDPGHPAVVDFYREYHGSKGDPQKLLQTLEQALRLQTDPARKIEMAMDLARVAEEEVGNYDKAIEAWKGVLRMEPGRPDAGEALMRLYRKAEKWNALRELLKQQIDALPADAVDEKIARYLEMAAIYRDHLKLDVMVVSTYNAILQLRPDDRGALEALAECYSTMGRYSDLVNLLTRQAQIETDPNLKIDVFRRIARLWIERFGNHGQAIKPLEEILAIDPVDPDALAELREIHEKRHNWRGLYELGLKELERLEGKERRTRLAEIARIGIERLGDVRGAIHLWNQVLEHHPEDAEALEELAGLYERDKRWAAIIEIRRRQRELARGLDRMPILEKLAGLWTDRVRQPTRAAAVWREILDLRTDHPKALRTLTDLYVDEGDFDAVEELYARRGAWSELAEAFSQSSERVFRPEAKLALLERVATLALDGKRLGRPDAAVRAYERILALDPENVRAANALAPIYEEKGDHARLLSVYEVMLGGAETLNDRLDLLEKIRVLCEEHLGSPLQAFEWSARAFSLAPANEGWRREVERLAEAANAWQELVDVYVAQLPEIADSAARTAVERTVAETLRIRLDNPAEARPYYESVVESLPEDADALLALEQILTSMQDHAALVEVIQRLANLEPDARRRAELLKRRARIQSDKLDDIEAAAGTYEELLYLDPSSLSALRALEKIRRQQERWADVRDSLERQVEIVTDPAEQVDALFALGQVWEERLDDAEQAIERWAQAVAQDGRHRPSLTALERYLLPDSERRTQVARLLAPVYERTGAFWELAAALEIEISMEEDDEKRIALLERLARVNADRLSDQRGAYRARARIFELRPDDKENRVAMALRSSDAGETEDLAERYGRVLERTEGLLRRELALELGAIEEERLLRLDRAEAAYREALAADPGHHRAFEALHRVLTNAERFEDLRDLLFARVDHVKSIEELRELYYEAAELCDQVIADQDGAARAWERILELEPSATRAYRALVKYYTRRERWEDLDHLLGRQLANTEDAAEVRELRFRQAQVRLHNLGRIESAADMLEEIVEGPPLFEPALELLEQMRILDEVGVRVCQFLEPLHERLGEHVKLVEDLRLQRDAAGDPAADFQLTQRIAEVQERKLRDVPEAFASWRRALMLDPREAEPRRAIERLQSAFGDWPTVVETWSEVFEQAPADDLTLRADLASRAARIVEERLGDLDGAREAWRKVLDVDPESPSIAVPAATALARLAEQGGRFEELIESLRLLIRFADGPEPRADMLGRVARVYEEALGAVEEAITAWNDVLEIRPEGLEALDNLERLYVGGSRWADVADIVRRRIAISKEPRDRRDLRMRLGMLLEEMLGDPDEAVRSYREALDEVPGDPSALEALARLYEAAERWPDLLAVNEQQLAGATTPQARVELLIKTGVLLETRLLDVGGALERYREAINLDATAAEARARLEAMLQYDDYALRAAAVLEPVARAERAFDRLVVIHEIQVRAASSVAERVGLLRRIGSLHEQDLNDPTAAFEVAVRAVREARGEAGPLLGDGLKELSRLADALDLHAEEAATLQEVSPDLVDVDQRTEVALRIADIARLSLGDRALARDWYRRVLEAVPQDLQALSALEEIHREGEEWEALLEVCERRAEMATADASERIEYLVKIGDLCETRLDRPIESIAAHEQIMALNATEPRAIAALERLYTSVKRWPDLVRLLWHRVEHCETSDEALRLRMRIGDLHADQLGDRPAALDLYRAILTDRPDHSGAIRAIEVFLEDVDLRAIAAEALEPVYVAAQNWKGLVRVYEIKREVTSDTDLRRELGSKAARLYEEQLFDQDSAFAWYGLLWRDDPTDERSRDELIRLAGLLDRYGEAVALFDEFLDTAAEEGSTTLDVARLAAQILDEKLDDVDRARDYHMRVLRADWHDASAQADIERCLTRHERWVDLVEVYQEIAARTFEPVARRELLVRLARLIEDRLGAHADAVPIWREVLELDERDGVAIENLERLYAYLERDAELVELLVRQLEWADENARIVLKSRLAPLYERLYDQGSAIDCYEEVLRGSADSADALAALERLLAQGDYRLRVAQILQPVYEESGDFQKLVGVLEVKLEFEADRSERARMLREISRLEVERHHPQNAFDALVRAVREEPASREILTGLEALAGTLGRYSEMVRVLKGVVEEIYDAPLAAEIHGRIAVVAEEHLQDRDLAIEAWEKRLLLNATDVAALDALDRLLGESERFEKQIEILERKVQSRDDLDERKDLLRRIAGLQEQRLGRADLAVQTWKSLLVFDESDAGALDALERLYEASSQWIELVWIYQRKMEGIGNQAETRDLRLAIARVYADQINDPFEAIGAYKTVLDASPDDPEALAALDVLCEREQVPSDLLEVLEAEARIAAEDSQRDEFEIRAVRLLLGELADTHRAVSKLATIVERTPSHAEARSALEELCRRDDSRPVAAPVLDSLYRRIGEWTPLVELLEVRFSDEVDPAARAGRLREIAKLREEQLRDRRGAMEAYARALSEDPGLDDVNVELERLAGLEGAWAQLASIYAEHSERALEGRLVFRYAMRLGRLQEEALGDDDAAALAYRRALQVGLNEIEALHALDRVYARSSRWAELVDVLDRQIRLAPDASERAGLHLRMGQVREQGLEDGESALLSYRDALTEEPGNHNALEALERLMAQEALLPQVLNVLEPAYEASNQPKKRVELLMARLGITRDARDRSALLAKAAVIQETDLGEHEAALESVLRAMDAWPEDTRLLTAIDRLVERTGKYPEAVAKLADVLEGGLTADPAKTAGLLRARWLHEKLERSEEAEVALRAVLELDSDCSEALDRLEQIARASGEARKIVDVIDRRLEHQYSPEQRRPLLGEAAVLRETGLGDIDGALSMWRSALDIDGADAEAHASIVRLLESLDRPAELGQALLEHALLPDDESERLPFRRRAAEAFVRADQLDRASDVYREILDHDPSDIPTLEALEEIYGRRGDLASVKEILIRRMESVPPGAERNAILAKLGRISGEQGSSDEASVWYEQLRASDPANEEGLVQLEKLYEGDQKWFELVTVLRERAEVHLAKGDEKAEVAQLARAAQLYEEKLGDAQQAVLMLERLLSRDPENVSALSALARLHQASGQWDRCLEILGRALGLAGSKPEAADLHYQMGKVRAEGLGDPTGAEAHYARALEVQVAHAGALDALTEAARRRGDHARLAELLEQRGEATSDPRAKLAMLREVVSLYIDRLGQPENAVPSLEKAVKLAPEDVVLVRTLANLHFEAGRHEDAAACYERVVEIAGQRRPKDLAAVMRRLATIREQQGDIREALRWYEESHQMDATEGATLAALGRLYLDREDWDKARRIYRAILLGNLDEAAGMKKGDVYYNLGRIHAHMGETAKALGMYERGLEIEPESVRLRKAIEALRGGR